MNSQSDYDRLGGAEVLQNLIRQFIERVVRDPIIGFFFDRVDHELLIQRETEFAARHLGGPSEYTGKPVARAHKPHPINKGHFHRRLWILEETLKQAGVEEEIRERWLAHNRQLESAVTNGMECMD